ncbi:NmrA family NAD(P)-binding protein [Allokutzneria sp. A3M-2-11 16]|uniref:SDR family oxidoreductase n=1 Tax=Allokutzneria sp. A3M-2-11 16 TaxID=2962043 RepID=UPI0020B75B7C|nr:NmrA family NAD(P)-binding protein [Allokutzneria sp. A3M-2-11 16]MCP3805069.1 NmrA family NAD(P)-binding protein [Allokutzneria sp. A3M-2-11 16]
MSETHLVIGAGGQQGAAIARRLLDGGHRVRGLRRGLSTPDASPVDMEWVHGDLADADAVFEAFDGVSQAFLTIPLNFDESIVDGYVANIVTAAQKAGLRRLVFNTGNRRIPHRTGVPAFDVKSRAEQVLLDSGVPTVVLRPPIFLDNLAAPWARSALAGGVLPYPIPAGHRVAWLSHDDLAALLVAAASRDDLVGSTIDVGGRDVVTGPELAAAFSQALGHDIGYVPVDADDFEKGLAQEFDGATAAGIAGLYRHIAAPQHADLYASDPSAVEAAFGVPLTPLSTWITAQDWRAP